MKHSNYILRLAATAVIGIALFSNCSKERIEPEDTKEEYESAEDYLESKQNEQEYEITEEGTEPLEGEQGTKVYGSKDLLMFPDGSDVDFPYTIKLIEIYSPKDMVYYEMPSMSDQNLLSTHGEVRVRAFKDGVELVLRPNKVWQVELPNNSPVANKTIYYGSNEDSKVNWSNMYSDIFAVTTYGYSGNIKKLGWISCASSAYDANTNTISYSFESDSVSFNNLSVFVYLPEHEGLMLVENQKSAPLLIGSNMKVLVLGKQGEQLYNFYTEETISDAGTINILLKQTTDTELTSLLNSW